MTNIYEVIGQQVAVHGRDATDHVMAELGVPVKWAAVFRPLVEDEVSTRARARVRAIEDRAFTGGGPGPHDTQSSSASPVDAVNDRIALLRERVFIQSTGLYVPWGELTVEQHHECAERRRRFAAAEITAAVRHEASISLIESAGVTCLNEVEGIEALDLSGLVAA